MNPKQAMLEAVKRGDVDAVRQLLKADASLVAARTDGGTSAVLLATYYRQAAVVNLLIEHGAELDLFEAAASGRLERVRALLEANPAQVNAYAPDGFTPLGLAAYFGHAELVKLLLARGADPNLAAQNGMRVQPLHSAVAGSDAAAAYAIAELLLQHGADVNAAQEKGFRPLHEAAFHGQADLARLLLAQGADPQARTEAGVTPLDLARQHGHREVAAMLEQSLAKP